MLLYRAVLTDSNQFGLMVTLWTVRLATLGYVWALFCWLTGRERMAKAAWTLGCVWYLAHVAAAFGFRYDWSHTVAYAETARQTGELFGVFWGGGIYFNYLFTAVWTADVIWLWMSPASYWTRGRSWNYGVHGFMGFLFVNAAIVFPKGWIRWVSLVALVVLLGLWISSRRTPQRR